MTYDGKLALRPRGIPLKQRFKVPGRSGYGNTLDLRSNLLNLTVPINILPGFLRGITRIRYSEAHAGVKVRKKKPAKHDGHRTALDYGRESVCKVQRSRNLATWACRIPSQNIRFRFENASILCTPVVHYRMRFLSRARATGHEI